MQYYVDCHGRADDGGKTNGRKLGEEGRNKRKRGGRVSVMTQKANYEMTDFILTSAE